MQQLRACMDRTEQEVMSTFKRTAPNGISTKEGLDDDWRDKSYDSKKLGPMTIIWKNVLIFLVFHVATIYGIYLAFVSAKWQSLLFTLFLYVASALSLTAGAHRLWSHNCYKAKVPLRIFLATGHAITWQRNLYSWSRDHRLHHKFPETNADPTNVKRGFFFAHMGWLMVKKQDDLIEKGKAVDCSDILADPVARIQRRFYMPIAIIFGLIIPAIFPYYFWNEHWTVCIFTVVVIRVMAILHVTSLGNSVSHLWGMKPYDKDSSATDNLWMSVLSLGGGFHNYHHAFPLDYASSELGYTCNFCTFFIDCMAYIGQAYDLKTTSPESVLQRKLKKGDGSYLNENQRIEWAKQKQLN